MSYSKRASAFIALLLLTDSVLMAQTDLPSGSQTKMFEMTSRIADIDSSLQIDHYPLAQRRKLLAQLYEIDQRYRDSLVNGSKSVLKQQLFSHKMIANDQANRVLLAKFISRLVATTKAGQISNMNIKH